MSTCMLEPELLEIKNTFLQFPMPVIAPLAYTPCRRSVSCPAEGLRCCVNQEVVNEKYEKSQLEALVLLAGEKSDERWADAVDAADSTDCSTRSCNSRLEDSTIESQSPVNTEYNEHAASTTRRSGRVRKAPHATNVTNAAVAASYVPDDGYTWASSTWNAGAVSPTAASAAATVTGQGLPAERNLKGRKSCLLLRGLPFSSTEADVLAFIEHAGAYSYLAPQKPVVLLSNPQGRPSGFAEVYLANPSDVAEVREKLDMQRLGGRYIEVLSPHPPPKWSGRGSSGGSRHERSGRDRHRGGGGAAAAGSWRCQMWLSAGSTPNAT